MISLAEGIRRVFDWRVECKFVQEVYRGAEGAPRESQFSGGVPFNIEEVQY
jgi:hypothetical protein